MDTAERLLREAREVIRRDFMIQGSEALLNLVRRIDAFLSSIESNESAACKGEWSERPGGYAGATFYCDEHPQCKTDKDCPIMSKESVTIDRVMNKALRRSVEIIDAPPTPTVPEEPKRYEDTGDRRRVQPHPHGRYVLWEDSRSLLAQREGMVDWTSIEEPPFVSGWRWIEFWYPNSLRITLQRFQAGDELPLFVSHWRFVDPPRLSARERKE